MGEDPKPECFAAKCLRLLAALLHASLWVGERALAPKPCQLAITLMFAGLAFLLLASQGKHVARARIERRTSDRIFLRTFCFFAATLA